VDLVDEVILDQLLNQLDAAGDLDVAVHLLLQPGHLLDDVACDLDLTDAEAKALGGRSVARRGRRPKTS
jgi:hypothetical protein